MRKIFKNPTVQSKSLVNNQAMPPTKSGNYFTLLDDQEYRVTNCNYENYNHIHQTKGTDNLQVETFGNLAVIIDRRFPDEYLFNKINIAGWGYQSTDQLITIHRYMGLDYTKALIEHLSRNPILITGEHCTGNEETYHVYFNCPKCKYDEIIQDHNYCPSCGIRITFDPKAEEQYYQILKERRKERDKIMKNFTL